MTHGPEAVAELVEEAGLSYPVTVSRLERKFPLENIEIDERGNMIMLSELLLDVDFDKFEDREDLERKLEPVMRAESKSRRVGIVGKIKRSLFGR
ncbi:MAG: hypothetical protein ABEJ70_06680 [Halobacteriaceae archaeon]